MMESYSYHLHIFNKYCEKNNLNNFKMLIRLMPILIIFAIIMDQ